MNDQLFTAVEPFEFRLARPDSKKNNMIAVRYGRNIRVMPTATVRKQSEAIEHYLCTHVPGELPLFGDRDVAVEITHHARSDMLTVRVSDMGSRPVGFTGRKRDLGNIDDLLLDAMQGSIYANDNQVVRILKTRTRED